MNAKSAKGSVTHYDEAGKVVSSRKIELKWTIVNGKRVSTEAAKPRRKRRKAS